jgi:TetR/AcrR family transcriptional regulator
MAKSQLLPRQQNNAARREAILDAGLEVFSSFGLRGATIDSIAERAGLSKTNLLYYFPDKQDLYLAVLRRVMVVWLDPLQSFDASSKPAAALKHYVRTKLTLSRDLPQASRLYALEIVSGAPMLKRELATKVRPFIEAKVAIIQTWIDDGRVKAHDPYHLLFAVWALTQHYADFSVQVQAITGRGLDDPDFFESTVESTQRMILSSVGLK